MLGYWTSNKNGFNTTLEHFFGPLSDVIKPLAGFILTLEHFWELPEHFFGPPNEVTKPLVDFILTPEHFWELPEHFFGPLNEVNMPSKTVQSKPEHFPQPFEHFFEWLEHLCQAPNESFEPCRKVVQCFDDFPQGLPEGNMSFEKVFEAQVKVDEPFEHFSQ